MRLYFGQGFYVQGLTNSMNKADCAKWFDISKTIKRHTFYTFDQQDFTVGRATKLNKMNKKAKS